MKIAIHSMIGSYQSQTCDISKSCINITTYNLYIIKQDYDRIVGKVLFIKTKNNKNTILEKFLFNGEIDHSGILNARYGKDKTLKITPSIGKKYHLIYQNERGIFCYLYLKKISDKID